MVFCVWRGLESIRAHKYAAGHHTCSITPNTQPAAKYLACLKNAAGREPRSPPHQSGQSVGFLSVYTA